MSYLKSLYGHCLQQPLHNHSRLGGYDLFDRQEKKVLSHAILYDFGEAEIFSVSGEMPKQVEIHEWNYGCPSGEPGRFSTRYLFTVPVRHCNGRWMLEHFSLNPNFSLCIRSGSDCVGLFHDTRPESRLISYFDASDSAEMGSFLQDGWADFRLWSPPAGRVQLLLFDSNHTLIETPMMLDLKNSGKGMWQGRFNMGEITDHLQNSTIYYQYLVYAYGKARLCCDPYAWSLAGYCSGQEDGIGKAALIDRRLVKPIGTLPAFTKPVSGMLAYEAHIRDFTCDETFTDEERGTYGGFVKTLPHIASCGFTHLQLMPVMHFCTVNERDRSLYAVHNGLANYNWGYDAHHYFAPSGWYSENPDDPTLRISELQSLASAVHGQGLGLIYDVVYNHTYFAETLENAAPGWYCRQGEPGRISGHTGAGAGIETRFPMTRRLITDSLKHYIRYYGADGFRFDLASFIDHDTLLQIRREAGSVYCVENPAALVLYGEGWQFTDIPEKQACTRRNPPPPEAQFALFGDGLRDGLLGSLHGCGMLQGNADAAPLLAAAITGCCKTVNPGRVVFNTTGYHHPDVLVAQHPGQVVNMISVHDGFTLFDKINLTLPAGRDEKIRRLCQAATVLFTAQGKIVWQGGEEMIRVKPAGEFDREPWRAHTSGNAEPFSGVDRFHENSFGASDFTNMVRRNMEGSEKVIAYISALTAMRKKLKWFSDDGNDLRGRFRFTEPWAGSADAFHYASFADPALQSLTLHFVNGPADATCYLCGEVQPAGSDGNPAANPFVVRFDMNGNGYLTFTRKDMDAFDYGKWGSADGLLVKLVMTPGQWDRPPGAYSPAGNNTLLPWAITADSELVVDLAVTDWSPQPLPQKAYLAFEFDLLPDSGYASVLVVHNFQGELLSVPVKGLAVRKPMILADSERADANGLGDSDYVRFDASDMLTVAANTSVVIAFVEKCKNY